MAKNNLKNLSHPDPDLDLHQNRINSSSSYTQPVHQVSSESVHNLLRYRAIYRFWPDFPPLPTIWFADKPSGKLPNIIVTSATKGRWRWCVHPDLSVWLFVCLWTGYLKRLWTNLDKVIRFTVKIRIRIREFFEFSKWFFTVDWLI